MFRHYPPWALTALLCSCTIAALDAQTVTFSDQPGGPEGSAPVVTKKSPANATFFPGSFWVNSGYISPLESSNVLTTGAFEQGFTMIKRGAHSLVPYGAVMFTMDQAGYDWNNKAVTQLGLKYVRGFRNGVVQAGVGYGYEHRVRGNLSTGQPIAFANYWLGWNRDLPGVGSRGWLSSLPGTSWAAIGNQVPAERNNMLLAIYAQQGVSLLTIGRVSLIPFVEYTLSVDSAGYAWNNRRTLGEGLKLRVPVGRSVVETAALYKHERRWRDRQTANGFSASANLWYGWNPSRQKEK